MFSAIFNFIVAGLCFWFIMGALVCLVVWVPIFLDPQKLRFFSDEELRRSLAKDDPHPVYAFLYTVFANRVGAVILTVIIWPIFIYLKVRGNRHGR